MTVLARMLLIAMLICQQVIGQPSIESIISKSKDFYSTVNSGAFKVNYRFKSSIAESFSVHDYTIRFCKNENISRMATDKTESILTKNHYYFVEKGRKQFIDNKKT